MQNPKQIDQYPPKLGEGWLMSQDQQLICRFTNALPSAHAKWVLVETRPLLGNGHPIRRRMLRHNAVQAWEQMLKTGWVRCVPRW